MLGLGRIIDKADDKVGGEVDDNAVNHMCQTEEILAGQPSAYAVAVATTYLKPRSEK